MTPDRLQRLQQLFVEALDLPPERWPSFLARACGDDAALRAEVESLLEHNRAAGEAFMRVRSDGLGTGRSGTLDAAEAPAVPPRDRGERATVEIEGYTILRELSRGGQGVVYEALQQSPRRNVAIKVLLDGSRASHAVRRRFKREIELVAQLRHPNIISIFHSGTTRDGARYYVMDYVSGVPLDRYVRMHRLNLHETLRLLATVCDAVQYAHQKGVLHRDLKPTNILVDGDGVPRVLDFGLAKPLVAPADTRISLSREIIGTLPYMAPEQVGGESDETDIRTDVYALGVILYQLLTGRHPYPVDGPITDVLRHICDAAPAPPSRAWLRGTGVGPRSGGRLRGECPIDNEVETIVLKALAKERARRYQSAGELARDIRRYLAGEPIEAKADSPAYVLWKQTRRYFRQTPVAALALLVALLTPGLLLALSFWHQAVRQRDTARAAIHFLNDDVFGSLDPERSGRDVDLTNILDAAAARIEDRFADAPLAEATIRHTLGNFYGSLGENDEALAQLDRALELTRAALGDRDPAVADLHVSLSRVMENLGRDEQAEQHLRAALAIRTAALGREAPATRATVALLADFAERQGNLELAAILRAQLGTRSPPAPAASIETLRRRLADARRRRGDHHPELAVRLGELADRLAAEGHLAEARPLYEQALAIWTAQLGPDHPRACETFAKLEDLFDRLGTPERQAALVRDRLERALAGGDNPRFLSRAAWDVAKNPHYLPELYARAVEAARRACRLRPENGAFLNTLGVAQYRAGLFEQAVATLTHSDKLNDGHPADLAFLAMAYARLGRVDEARQVFARLQTLVQHPPWATDRQSRRFFREAAALMGSDGGAR